MTKIKTNTKMNDVKSSEKAWSRDEIDYLLDKLFELQIDGDHKWNLACKKVSPWFGRSIDSIQTLVRKLCIRYPDHSDYKPIARCDRIGLPFEWLDKYILRTADTWIRDKASYKPLPDDLYLAGVLGRDPKDLATYRQQQQAKGRKSLDVFK
jgi:hypothetical protein